MVITTVKVQIHDTGTVKLVALRALAQSHRQPDLGNEMCRLFKGGTRKTL
jgi:hypothetical protein